MVILTPSLGSHSNHSEWNLLQQQESWFEASGSSSLFEWEAVRCYEAHSPPHGFLVGILMLSVYFNVYLRLLYIFPWGHVIVYLQWLDIMLTATSLVRFIWHHSATMTYLHHCRANYIAFSWDLILLFTQVTYLSANWTF